MEPKDAVATDLLQDTDLVEPRYVAVMEPEEKEEDEEEDDDDDDDDSVFSAWMSRYKAAEEEKEKEKEKEREMMKNKEADRKCSFDQPARQRADRRASLPCPAQLSAMQLSRLHSATKPPASARTHSRGRIFSNEESGPAKPAAITERRPSVIQTIPEVAEVPERKTRFRRRNVMSLSDADRVCLICHDDLHRGGSGIRELHCSHSFHSECIEEWLWRKQACPTCRVQVPTPEPLYWTSAQAKVP